jgi:hypothetical protein
MARTMAPVIAGRLQVVCHVLAYGQAVRHSRFHAPGCPKLAQMAEHQDAAEDGQF